MVSNATYLLLEGGRDQAPQLRKAAVDAVPAPLLYDLKHKGKKLGSAGTSSLFPTCPDGH